MVGNGRAALVLGLLLIAPDAFGEGTRVDKTVEIAGTQRTYIVHLPKGHDAKIKVPVVFMFHGGGGVGLKYFNTSQWKETGNTNGFISVFPTAQNTCLARGGGEDYGNYWMTANKLLVVCANTPVPDDVAFVTAMLGALRTEYAVDDARIYAAGFSNGMGFILSQILVKLAHEFAAVGGAGSILTTDKTYVVPPNPSTPVYAMMGQVDDQFDGIIDLPITYGPYKQSQYIDKMETAMTAVVGVKKSPFVAKRFPKYMKAMYTKPLDSGAQKLYVAILEGLDHVWPQGRPETDKDNGLVAAQILWTFFKKNPQPLKKSATPLLGR